jgi:hypothetical protein
LARNTHLARNIKPLLSLLNGPAPEQDQNKSLQNRLQNSWGKPG